MTKHYQHTQIGYFIIIALAIALTLNGYIMTVYGFNWVAFAVLIILGVCLMIFATLTVVIEGGFLKVRFGLGIIQKKFLLKDIESSKL